MSSKGSVPQLFHTKFTSLTGVKHPVMCGGMHYVGYASLAAAVSNAGGLGTITALTQSSPEDLRKEIKKGISLLDKGMLENHTIMNNMNNKSSVKCPPLAVNVTLLPMLAPPNYDEYANVIIEEGIRIVETAGRNPEKFIKFFKSKGCIVIHKCVAVKHAISAQKSGADMISIDGYECGGHPGENDVTNWVLLAKLKLSSNKLTIPYIVSGSCATGSQLAAALVMGAEGFNCGTRFIATKEAPVKDGIKQAIVNASEYDTTLVFTTLSNTERVFKNPTAMEVREREKKDPGDFSKIADLVKGAKYRISFQETGNSEDSVWSCGQSIGLVEEVLSCKDLIEGIVVEAKKCMMEGVEGKIVKSKL